MFGALPFVGRFIPKRKPIIVAPNGGTWWEKLASFPYPLTHEWMRVALRQACGPLNSRPFRGHPAGTVQCTGWSWTASEIHAEFIVGKISHPHIKGRSVDFNEWGGSVTRVFAEP